MLIYIQYGLDYCISILSAYCINHCILWGTLHAQMLTLAFRKGLSEQYKRKYSDVDPTESTFGTRHCCEIWPPQVQMWLPAHPHLTKDNLNPFFQTSGGNKVHKATLCLPESLGAFFPSSEVPSAPLDPLYAKCKYKL